MQFGALVAPLGCLEPVVRRVLKASVDRDPVENMDDVIGQIECGEATAWLVNEGERVRSVAVTKMVTTTSGKQCVVWHCAGEGAREWIKFLRLIEEWAHDQGCDSIEIPYARIGWERLLGWSKPAVVLRKELGFGRH